MISACHNRDCAWHISQNYIFMDIMFTVKQSQSKTYILLSVHKKVLCLYSGWLNIWTWTMNMAHNKTWKPHTLSHNCGYSEIDWFVFTFRFNFLNIHLLFPVINILQSSFFMSDNDTELISIIPFFCHFSSYKWIWLMLT